jgi:hypothetical protein
MSHKTMGPHGLLQGYLYAFSYLFIATVGSESFLCPSVDLSGHLAYNPSMQSNSIFGRLERILTMVYVAQNFLDFSIILYSQKKRRFGNWICFRPQGKVGEKTPTQLGPLDRANLNHWTGPVVFFGIQDDGKSPEKFCEFCITASYSIALQRRHVTRREMSCCKVDAGL